MPDSIRLAKQTLRKEIRKRKQQYSSEQLNAMSQHFVQQLLVHPRVKNAQSIMLYYSLPDEVCTHQLVDSLAAMGKTVLLPAVVSDTEMVLRQYRSANDLRLGAFNIMEPCGELFEYYDAIETAVVPGMAFTCEGLRLGRGKGYYDRLLVQLTDTYTIGICFPFQVVETIPCDQYDCRVDELLSSCVNPDIEKKIYKVKTKKDEE